MRRQFYMGDAFCIGDSEFLVGARQFCMGDGSCMGDRLFLH